VGACISQAIENRSLAFLQHLLSQYRKYAESAIPTLSLLDIGLRRETREPLAQPAMPSGQMLFRFTPVSGYHDTQTAMGPATGGPS
jgi:hypothetical protein